MRTQAISETKALGMEETSVATLAGRTGDWGGQSSSIESGNAREWMSRGIAEQYEGYLSACASSRPSLVPSLSQLLIYSNSNLKYSPLLIGAQHNLIIDLWSSLVPIFLRCAPGGFSLRAAGGNGGALQHFYLGSPRWAMVGCTSASGDRCATYSRPR